MTRDLFADVLDKGASVRAWKKLIALFDGLRAPEREQEIVRFVEARLAAWPDAMRTAPEHWWSQLARNEAPRPAWSLIRSLAVPDGHDELPPVEHLAHIRMLRPHPVTTKHELSRIGRLVALERLDLSGVRAVDDSAMLSGLARLRWLSLSRCSGLREVEGLRGHDALRFLDLSGCTGLTDLSGLESLPLEILVATDCDGVTDFAVVSTLRGLQRLDVGGEHLHDVAALVGSMSEVDSLKIARCPRLIDVRPLAGFSHVKTLCLASCERLQAVGVVAELSGLSELTLHDLPALQDLSPLANMPALIRLCLSNLPQVDTVPLAIPGNLPHLEHVQITRLDALRDLSGLSGLSGLRRLTITRCRSLSDLGALRKHENLEFLDLKGNPGITDISPLLELPRLQRVELQACNAVRNAHLLESRAGLNVAH